MSFSGEVPGQSKRLRIEYDQAPTLDQVASENLVRAGHQP